MRQAKQLSFQSSLEEKKKRVCFPLPHSFGRYTIPPSFPSKLSPPPPKHGLFLAMIFGDETDIFGVDFWGTKPTFLAMIFGDETDIFGDDFLEGKTDIFWRWSPPKSWGGRTLWWQVALKHKSTVGTPLAHYGSIMAIFKFQIALKCPERVRFARTNTIQGRLLIRELRLGSPWLIR